MQHPKCYRFCIELGKNKSFSHVITVFPHNHYMEFVLRPYIGINRYNDFKDIEDDIISYLYKSPIIKSGDIITNITLSEIIPSGKHELNANPTWKEKYIPIQVFKEFEEEFLIYMNMYTKSLREASSAFVGLHAGLFITAEEHRVFEDAELENILDTLYNTLKGASQRAPLHEKIKRSLDRYKILTRIILEDITEFRKFIKISTDCQEIFNNGCDSMNKYLKNHDTNKFIEMARSEIRPLSTKFVINSKFINNASERIIITDDKGPIPILQETFYKF